jgi:hypothetical protein
VAETHSDGPVYGEAEVESCCDLNSGLVVQIMGREGEKEVWVVMIVDAPKK